MDKALRNLDQNRDLELEQNLDLLQDIKNEIKALYADYEVNIQDGTILNEAEDELSEMVRSFKYL